VKKDLLQKQAQIFPQKKGFRFFFLLRLKC